MGKCYKCGKETDRLFWSNRDLAKRLDEEDKYWCQECRDKADAFREWENEQSFTEEIVCPWCGEEQSDSWECCDWDYEYECMNCGKMFEYERNVEVTYTSKKRECDYPGGDSNE